MSLLAPDSAAGRYISLPVFWILDLSSTLTEGLTGSVLVLLISTTPTPSTTGSTWSATTESVEEALSVLSNAGTSKP